MMFNLESKTEKPKRYVLSCGDAPSIAVSPPPEFGGETNHWTPEDLLNASVVSCFQATLLHLMQRSKLESEGLEIRSSLGMEKIDGKLTIARIDLSVSYPNIKISVEDFRQMLVKAESYCPVSAVIRCPIEIKLSDS